MTDATRIAEPVALDGDAAARVSSRSGCAGGGWSSAVPTIPTPTAPACRWRAPTHASTRRWRRSTTPGRRGRRAVAAAPVDCRGRRRRSLAGSVTSAATSRPRPCRCCNATPSTASTCNGCCSSRRCSRRSSRTCTCVTLLMELNKLLPETTRATARQVVAGVVEQIRRRLVAPTQQAVHGALARAQRGRRPRPADIDWPHTIQANLRNYLPGAAHGRPRAARRATAGGSAAWLARSSWPSTRAGRWPTASSTPRVFGAVLASSCRRCARA